MLQCFVDSCDLHWFTLLCSCSFCYWTYVSVYHLIDRFPFICILVVLFFFFCLWIDFMFRRLVLFILRYCSVLLAWIILYWSHGQMFSQSCGLPCLTFLLSSSDCSWGSVWFMCSTTNGLFNVLTFSDNSRPRFPHLTVEKKSLFLWFELYFLAAFLFPHKNGRTRNKTEVGCLCVTWRVRASLRLVESSAWTIMRDTELANCRDSH
jgi:hypothetical protein